MLREFKADLHIHTCLSPCGDKNMTPRNIAKQAKDAGLDIIAVCDHNASENSAAVRAACEKTGVKVIAGMEVTSSEEVHLIALFDNGGALKSFQGLVYENLAGKNDEDEFGLQVIMNEDDGIEDKNRKLLIGATALTVEALVDSIHSLDGLVFASHIDRAGFGIIGQLGFIPEGLALDAVEVSPGITVTRAKNEIPGAGRYPVVTFSDAHFLNDIGRAYTVFVMENAGLPELKKALLGIEGRKVR
jgi:PHP family Zn ribbon phosphoesterase